MIYIMFVIFIDVFSLLGGQWFQCYLKYMKVRVKVLCVKWFRVCFFGMFLGDRLMYCMKFFENVVFVE